MFVHYRTQGIVLKKEDRFEADQLFTVYTKDFGKLEILGKGIRKIKSKLRPSIDLFYLSEIEFIQGRTYKTLTDVILIDKFENLRKDLKRLAIAFKITETADELIAGQEPDEKIWYLLKETLKKLNQPSFQVFDWRLVYCYFFWNLISFLGYKPQLYFCVFCQKRLIPEKIYFSLQEGGTICQKCHKKFSKGREVSLDTIKILRIFLAKEVSTLSKLKIELKSLKQLINLTKYYLTYLKRQ